MNIYISGISGTGMGPLALMAKAAGFTVWGSDLAKGAIYDELIKAGIEVKIGSQDGEFLQEKLEKDGVDWFVYTSALPEDHKELVLAREAGIKCTKRDDFTAFLVAELGLKMVAVAGTHGKTTTTAMIVWAALKLGLPVSYIVGTTLGFAPSGSYKAGDQYFIYEADEYDRNFLKYHPWLAVIPAVSYDHPDIYPTVENYREAFRQFEGQSERVVKQSSFNEDGFKLAGEVRRKDAALAAEAIQAMAPEAQREEIVEILDEFPGVGRRFEKINEGVYTDYAHHPEEIAATMGVIKDEKRLHGKKGIVVVYQPHQNTRQHEVRSGYTDAFLGADKIYWLSTYLTRENLDLPVLTPTELISGLVNKDIAEVAELNDELAEKLQKYMDDNYLVILMTAGPADEWLWGKFSK
jgi:UDP-N-acetylmuramate--alanine ligase